ncbi:MAG: carbohydrate kinase [Thermofilum sp. ex4484_15]|nr:MAG: carbohydrate kinase [Thermofilum sp. ex4484_15]
MVDVLSLGELLVEIMRVKRDVPHTVRGEYSGPYPSGAPAIFADAVARLGVSVGFLGCVGGDDFGRLLLDRFKSDGVEVGGVRVLEGFTTGIAFVAYFKDGSRRFVFHLRYSASGFLSPEMVEERFFEGAKLLHVSGSSLAVSDRLRDSCLKALKLARDYGLKVSFDPNLRLELAPLAKWRELVKPFSEADIICPSFEDASALTGLKDPWEVAEGFQAEVVAVKLGAKGSIALWSGKRYSQPAFKVREVDPTGAGDVYDAALAVAYLKHLPPNQALKFANAAAAIKVSREGSMEGPRLREVLKFLKDRGEEINLVP